MIRMCMFPLVICLILTLGCGEKEETTEPATTGQIEGVVYDAENGEAINKANVRTNPPSSAVTTDSLGKYNIKNIEPCNYHVTAVKSGYDSAGVNISVTAGNTAIADIPLLSDTTAAGNK